MLANLRRKVGMGGPGNNNNPAPTMPPPQFPENMVLSPTFQDPSLPPPFTMEELGFSWPNERGIFSPAAIPVWIQEQVGVCTFLVLYRDRLIIFTEPRGPGPSR